MEYSCDFCCCPYLKKHTSDQNKIIFIIIIAIWIILTPRDGHVTFHHVSSFLLSYNRFYYFSLSFIIFCTLKWSCIVYLSFSFINYLVLFWHIAVTLQIFIIHYHSLLAPSGALIAIPTYYWPSSTTTPLFQITPVLNTGLSLSEPLQLYKGYNAI